MSTLSDRPWIVMRSHNDANVIESTLEALSRQTHPFELIVFDNRSTDQTRNIAAKYTDHLVDVPQYVSGEVLNHGMAKTTGEIVVFLNSDCTPVNEFWLERLLNGFTGDDVAAVFGRQIPRPDCRPLFAKDTEDTYGDGNRRKDWRNRFSMASCAIRRSVWETIKFNENLCISEDIDWTWRARQSGFRIEYVPGSVVLHSHNYTLHSFFQRQFKEGRDEALIYDLTPWERSFVRYSILPLGRQILSDWVHAVNTRSPNVILFSPVLRLTQMTARRRGFRLGLREKGDTASAERDDKATP